MNFSSNRKASKSAAFSAVLFGLFVFSGLLSAETRIKTVEYNFGGYYNAANLASATQYNFPARNIKLPENGKNIRSAWLEYEGFTAAATNVNPLVIYFDAALTPATARFTSGQYTAQTGESIALFAKADVTSVIQSQINNLASGVNFAAGIRITGPATNSHRMKLFITYEYDDESPLQVKTVRFPLYSDHANGIASFLSQQAAGTRSMQYLADISETNSFKIQQQWFEIKGYRQDPGSTTDGSIYLNVGGGANEPTMYLDSGLRDSYYFKYVSSSTIVPGFSTGTLQTVNIVYTQNAINDLGGEAVITYEFSPSSAYKTETASFYWGQYISSGAAASYYFGRPLVLKEEGVTVKEMYLRVYGSYDSTTGGNVTLLSKIGSSPGTSRSYAQIVTQAQISGYEFIHSLKDIASLWTNGEIVGSTITLPVNAGAHGMELVVTYSYANGAAHSTNYSVYAGNPAVYTSHPYSYTSSTYWVEAGSSKTLNSAFLNAAFLSNSATQDFSNTLSFNSNSPSAAFHKTTIEAALTRRLYENNSQVQIGTTSVTSNYSSSVNLGPMSGELKINYGYVPPPKIPYSLSQYIPGGAQIMPGQWINSRNVRFEGVLSSSMSADTLSLVVEVKPAASSFDGAGLSTGPAFSYSGTPLSTSVAVSGLISGTVYKWRAAGLGLGNLGLWSDFTAPSFAVDLSSPPAPALISITPADGSYRNYTNAAFSFETVSDIDGSGVKNYELWLATSSDFTAVSFSSQPVSASAYVSGLSEKTYYWKVRAHDNAGNIGSWSAVRSFTVDLSTPSITDNQTGDFVWRNSNSGIYNVDFADSGGSNLYKFQVKAASGPNQGGVVFADWTDAVTAINSASYSADWVLPVSVWNALQEYATNYISVRVYDNAGNYSVMEDLFRVFKDTTAPSITDNQSGDDVWRNAAGTSYNVDFADYSSGLSGASYAARTSPLGGGTLVISTTAIASVGGKVFTGDWQVDFASLADSVTNYISVEVYDIAGNTSTVSDIFYVKKDTTPPSITDNQSGDDVWRNTAGTLYNVDFADAGSALSAAYYEVWTGPGKTGLKKVDISAIPSVSGKVFSSDWQVDFASLEDSSTNYVSVQVYDAAGNSSTVEDVFYVKKDTTPPSVIDNQNGDDIWRNSAGTLYNVDFADAGSGLYGAKYSAWTGPGKTGIERIALASIPSVGGKTFSSDWSVDFNSLVSADTNYISAEVYDIAGNTVAANDLFYVKKDTVVPYLAISTPSAGYSYLNDPGNVVNIDFFDSDSGLDFIEYKVTTAPAYGGDIVIDWTGFLDLNGEKSYLNNWDINFLSLPVGATSYVSLRVHDSAGNVYEQPDAFFFYRQAPDAPSIIDNQPGDYTWRNSSGTYYDVDFISYQGIVNISSFAITAYTGVNKTGTMVFDWQQMASNINALSYTADWRLSVAQWNLLLPGTNYISVKVWGEDGLFREADDVFFILKDTQLPSGLISGPLYSNALSFPVAFSASDDGPSGPQYAKLFYTYDNYAPYTWLQYGGSWTSSPVNFSASQWGKVGFRLLVYDYAGNRDELFDPPLSSTAPEFYSLADSTYPAIINNQSGDFLWRSSSGTYYDVDFTASGGSPLDSAQYAVYSATGCSGNIIKGWTDIASGINSTSYSNDWQVDFNSLNSYTNYIANRVTNMAGNTAYFCDVFFVKKDTVPPSIVNNQTGDNSWRNGNDALYDIDFYDGESLLKEFSVKITSGPGQSGTLIADWTAISANISSSSYTQNWGLSLGLWNLLPSGTSYVSVRVEDNAGNKAYLSDAFYIKKDTEAPSITDSQSGDSLWRASNSGTYSVSFADSGGSLLNEFKVRAYSGAGQTGLLLADWTQVQGGINSNSYLSPWSLPAGFWSLLPEGTSYISVAVYDNAGNSGQLADVFYVKKDITGPSFVNNQSGDDVWRLSSGTVYNVGFNDDFSNVKGFEVKITSGPGQTGQIIADWTTAAGNINSPYYVTPWALPSSLWPLIPSGASYVSVRSSDMAGNNSYLYDAFYVRKDTIAPSITDNQTGEYLWHALNSNYYDVDFYDSLSGVNRFQIKLTSGPAQTGTVYADWTDNTVNINQPSYSSNWQIMPAIWDLAPSGTSYVSVRVFDSVGLSAVSTDTFVLLKDTVAPDAISNLSAITGLEGEIAISFTAPQDIGELSYYIVKYATYQINASNFAYASEYPQSWPPSPKGSQESFTLSGLNPSAVYYAAVKTADQAGNISELSNSPSASAGADSTAPSAITDLAASPGAFGGQINLSWTAPGDSVDIGTAASYLVRYRTDAAISNAALWNTASVYPQSWQPLGSGESESYVISGFTPGTTYYFAVRAADEVNNIGNLSNSPSAWAQFPGSRAGVMVYQNGTNNTPNYKQWDGSAFGTSAAAPATAASASSNIRHIIVRASPLRKEKMAGILSSDGVLQIQRYDQITSSWSNEWSTTTIGATNSAYRGFDIAYEQKTGRCLVLYNGATAGTLYYKIYDGSLWSPTYTLSAGSSYASLWVRLEPRPDSNQILAAFSKATSLEIYAIIWDGSSWVNGQQIRTGVGITTKQDWDIAWESKSGKALAVYNNNVTGRADTYRWDGSSWSQFNLSYFSFVGANGTAQWIRLASDPNSNYIAATSVDSASDWNASIWDGSGWGYQASENTNVRNNANQSRTVDAVWSSKSSLLMVVSGQGGTTNNIIFSSFTLSGGWLRTLAAAQTFGTWANRVYGLQLENDPNTDSLLLAGWDLSSNLKTASWNGYSWTFNPAASHSTALSQYSYMPAMVTLDRHDEIPPTLADNQSGDDIWRNSNSAYYNIDAYDSGGSYLKGLQTRIYSGPSQSGVQLEDWTYQVSTAGVNEYLSDWQFLPGSWNAMREGINYISVRALDNSLNTSQIITDAFYVKKDTTAPSIASLSFPADSSMIKNQAVFLDWSDSSDSASGLSGYDVLFSTDENFSSSNYSAFVTVSQATTSVMSEGKYYWKVRAKDRAGNYSLYTDTYSLTVDISAPVITNSQSGDVLWRNASGTVYNVDFADNYALSAIKYEAWTSPGRSGVNAVPQTDIAALSGESSYTSDWPVNFSLLSQGTNYISVTAYDSAGNSSYIVDAFYVKKDTAAPYFVNNQNGDDIWRSSAGQVYDVDFFDSLSGLSAAYYEAWTGPGKTGTMKIAPTAIPSVAGLSYSLNWSIDFSSLADSSTNYISLTLNDQAGNQAVLNDAFYVKKDTTAPSIASLSFPADSSMIKNQAVFLDWSDSSDSASGLSGYDVLFSTDENFSSINYSAFVTVSQTTTSVMSEGKYYWKVRAKDRAGNYSLYTATYSLTVDISAPVITNRQSGDILWRNASGTVYNVDFADNYALGAIKYEAWTSPGRSGVNAVPQTDIAALSGESSYTSDWPVNFSLLSQGTNYISVTAYDSAGNSSYIVDAFYVKKDTVSPVIVDNQPGDDMWRAINNGVYDVDFFDGHSYVKDVEIKITTGISQSGTVVLDWSVLYSALNRASFTDNWNISAAVWDLLPVTTNYVSIKVSDYAGNSSVLSDVFYIKKDTNPVNVVDNQPGDDVWRNANTAYYNVDAYSPTSPVDKLEVRVSTRPAYENVWLIPWSEVLSSIGLNSFTADWQLPGSVFDAMISGATNYVSVRFTNQAGLYNESMDLFYVKKDTVSPSAPLPEAPGNFSSTNTLNAAFDWTDSYEAQSGIEFYQITVSTDENFAVFSASGNYSSSNAVVALPSENNYYWKVRARDNAGNYSQWSSTYSVTVDTTAPVITDSQSGDDTWRNTNSGTYALSFSDNGGSLLDKVELRAQSAAGLGGISYFSWSEAVGGINAAVYNTPLSLPSVLWDLLASGTGYISAAAVDRAGNRSELIDAFYIRKDTVAPSSPLPEAPGNFSSTNTLNAAFDWTDSYEAQSGIEFYQIVVSTDENFAVFSDSGNYSSSNAVVALPSENNYYWKVRARDNAGNYSQWSSTYSVTVDTTAPVITDSQSGDDTWRNTNSGTYALSFSDNGGSLLDKVELRAQSAAGLGGISYFSWSEAVGGINAAVYNTPLSLPSVLWDLLASGTGYISAAAVDRAGNRSELIDAFYIRKDTTPAAIVDNQSGDDTWRSSDPGAVYNVDFEDFESEISSITYKVYSSANLGGTLVLGPTLISSSSTGFYSFSSNWPVNFAGLIEGFNYVTVNAYDRAGNFSELRDVFYVKKDTSGPLIADNQSGDEIWRAVNDGSYDADFYDYGIGVSTIAVSVWTAPGKTGTQLISSSAVYSGAPVNSYTDPISLTQAQWNLLRQGTNYVSLESWDALGSVSYLNDAFYIRKDTTAPSSISSLSAYTPSAASDEGKLLLTWTATGDDGLTGSASYYMVRYSQNLIDDSSFPSASVYVSTLVPRSAGQPESLLLSGLTPGVTYYAAVKAADKAGNISAISNSPNAYAGLDKTAPAAVSDLSSAQGDFTGQINLYWTAVGEGEAGLEGTGAAYSYLVKYSSSLWGGFDAAGVSTYTQTWVPQAKGQAEARIMDGLVPGATYSIAIKVIDEAGNMSPVSNVIAATAAPAGAADGLIVYSQSGTNDFKFRTWSPIVWSTQYDSAQSVPADALWIRLRSVPVVSNSKAAGILYSNNSLKFFRYNGLTGTWSDVTPSPAPNPAASNYRKFDIEVENNTGRIMVAYYNNTPGAITYAIYSATASAWVAGPSSLSLASLSGTINWVKMKSLPGSNKIALAALDSNSDISAAIWDGSAWGNNSNLTAAASLATKEVFDISWENLSGDLIAMWGTGTTTNYKKYYATSTWSASTLTGPNPAAAVQWLRLASDPLSNRIGASYLYGTTSWNAAIWRAAGTETWTASTADTTVSQVGTRIMDCAWQSKSSKFIAAAADEIGTVDNKFKTAVWTGGAWTATPSAGALNSYTVFAGSINWISLLPDPNTDNITLFGIDTAFDLRTTVWSGSAWADSSSSANFLQQNNLRSFLYESASVDFDRHDSVPPTVIDNQAGDDIWRNGNSGFYNIQATDSGGSHLAGIQTKIRTAASGGGTLVEDWTWQVSAINSDSYTTAWKLSDLTFSNLPQGQSYVWVRALDGVGNISTEISDAFYIRKDNIAPQIISNLPPDSFDSWTSTGVGNIDIDFSDSGYSHISSAAYSVWTGPGQTGINQVPAVIITSATASDSYSSDWSVDFSLLAAGTNYITVSVWDNASSSAALVDAFRILRDTIAPSSAVLSAAPGPLNGTVELSWNAPGDDGSVNSNIQGGYLVKYATYPIVTEQLFSAASTYAQSLLPLPAGSLQSLVIYELAGETTYYFAIKTYDKALNFSALSNSPSSLPGRNGLFINEIYPGGSSSSDWVEFYNNTGSPVSLNGWKIIYKQGALNTSAAEVQIWSGSASDIAASSSVYRVNLSYDINSAQSYSLLLKNSQGYLINSVQWPSMGVGESFARIYDGYALFEIDPTPTPGYANSISTSPIKINEVSYSGYQFIELYNNSSSTLTISDYYLRNSNGAPFRFDRKLYPQAYSAIDDTSFSKDGFDYYAAFGLSGLNQAGDFAVLENSAGQTIDRVTWQSLSNYSLYNYMGQKTSAVNYAPGAVTDISRLAAEGYDSDSDAADFAQALPTPYSRNTNAGQGPANTLYSPSDSSILPRVFPVSLRIGADSSSGSNSVFVMVRTGGAQDQHSPHIFRLADSGFNLSSLSVQTTVYESSYLYDIDGNSLVNGAVYRLFLTSDDSSKSAPLISVSNLLADFATHPVAVYKSAGVYLNENTSQAVFSISAADASLNYGLFFSSAIFRLTDKNSVALTQQEASNLLKSAAIYRDSPLGETGKYEAAVDDDMLEELPNSSFGVDSQGRVAISISSDSAFSSLALNSQATYYLVFRTTDNASLQTPREIMVTLDELRFRDSINLLYQRVSGFSPLQTSTLTFIRQASAPPGTNWPYSVPSPLLVETMADFYNDGLISDRVYISGKDGMLRTVGYDGNEKWVFAVSPVSAIKTAPLIREESGSVYLYFADSSGKVYKLKDNDSSASQEWKIDLGYQVSGNLMDNPSSADRLYLTTYDGRVHCLNKTDGSLCSGWTYDSGFNAPISGTLSIDYRPEVNMGWVGLENGKVAAFRLSDGLILNQFMTGGAVYASPFVDSAYSYANNNLYIASTDGKVYARNSANLTAVPPYWNDFNTGSAIYSSPFKGIYEDYLYVGDEAGRLYKISSTSGTVAGGWVYQAPEKIRTIPVAVPGINKVFFGSGEYLYCLNTADGTLCSGYPVYTGGFIRGDIVVDPSSNVIIFSSSDGKTYMISI